MVSSMADIMKYEYEKNGGKSPNIKRQDSQRIPKGFKRWWMKEKLDVMSGEIVGRRQIWVCKEVVAGAGAIASDATAQP